jgi:hypothetical protein
MKKSTAYLLLYFATILIVAFLSSCQTRSVVRPNPCPKFDKAHNRDMPYTHPTWR